MVSAHAVVIVGAGPTGLMLAGELALAGVDVAIVERRNNQDLIGARARGLHSRSIEILDQRGIADRFISQGKTYPIVHFHVPLDISDLSSRHNYVLGLEQKHIERILAEWIGELSVKIYRGLEVTGFTQDHTGVDIMLSDGQSLRSQYLVGCDGGRSLIRKTAGIEFPGWDATMSWIIAEAKTTEEPKWGFHVDARGSHAISKGDNGLVGIVLTEEQLQLGSKPSLHDVSNALIAVYGTDYGIHSPNWISRFTDVTRQASNYRNSRVLLAGDAAHVHPPLGGQGLNIGLQDAVNLGWKLAQVVKRKSPETLLDTYHTERHPVAARVLRTTMAQVALRRTDDRTKALGEIVVELLGMDQPRRRITAEIAGLGVRYDPGLSDIDNHHPLLGRRMPDLDLMTTNGTQRVFSLLNEALPLFLRFDKPGEFDMAPWSDRVRLVDAKSVSPWELPERETVPAPAGILVRPDGYIAWVGDRSGPALVDALVKWFGPAGATV